MRLKLAEFTSRVVGKPYKLGQTDCAGLIMEFANHVGVRLPDSWKGFSVSAYAELYRDDPVKAMGLFVEWATSVGREVAPCKAFAGDLLVASAKGAKQASLSLLIHAGQDQALCVLEKRGVCHVPLRAYQILKAYRWRDR